MINGEEGVRDGYGNLTPSLEKNNQSLIICMQQLL